MSRNNEMDVRTEEDNPRFVAAPAGKIGAGNMTRQWFNSRRELARPHRNLFPAGQHLAGWQGFVEGAAQTGEDAAKAVAG